MDFNSIIFGVPQNLTLIQLLIRIVIIFIYGLAIIRIGKKRFFGKHTAFDIIITVIIGSLLSRTLNGTAKFIPTVVACTTIIGLHWITSALISRFAFLSNWIEGQAELIVKQGKIQKNVLLKTHLTEKDILESARLSAHVTNLDDIHECFIENNGEISIILKKNNED